MASLQKEIVIEARPEDVWDAVRDVGALHTRLVPGFVVDTKLEGEERVVTFGNGLVAREPIISIDEGRKRLAWAARGGRTTHYNASLQVTAAEGATRVVWITDFLPHEMAGPIAAMEDQALAIMKRTLEGSRPRTV
jgi:carbon monoxide dehydrogenase subunit G